MWFEQVQSIIIFTQVRGKIASFLKISLHLLPEIAHKLYTRLVVIICKENFEISSVDVVAVIFPAVVNLMLEYLHFGCGLLYEASEKLIYYNLC